MFSFQGKIVRWIDGDTLVAELDLGFSLKIMTPIRLYGINCPELKTQEGKDIHTYVNTVWPPETPILAETIKPKEKYGRYLAKVSVGEIDIAKALLGRGMAQPFMVNHEAPKP